MKHCVKCGRYLSYDEFGKNKKAEDGLKQVCKTCLRQEQQSRYLNDRNYRIKRQETVRKHRGIIYRSEHRDFNTLYSIQKGLCKICETELNLDNRKEVHVDHDHITGLVRGILCRTCNLALGCMKDSPERLVSAAAYLLAFQSELLKSSVLTSEVGWNV